MDLEFHLLPVVVAANQLTLVTLLHLLNAFLVLTSCSSPPRAYPAFLSNTLNPSVLLYHQSSIAVVFSSSYF
ncbi:hypothetical protein BDV26DRAFT_168130 [Aspergillus bertholletiae]|uniref:Uncharacterized protein n=1 Tax=Aspergillus bertholletiae TaxID=1226010 RepID=A0A5N7BCE9_9EURO|nr:hypothetical protein BDV26DRAFT_168130 [Aspergillus bertholletiae]